MSQDRPYQLAPGRLPGPSVLVVGGGQSGLAAARALSELGMPALVLEASDRPVGSWPRYYDSLRLFSPAEYSSLPGMPFPGVPGRYPGRDEVAAYLEQYVAGLTVEIRTYTRVETIHQEGRQFVVVTANDACPIFPGPPGHAGLPQFVHVLERDYDREYAYEVWQGKLEPLQTIVEHRQDLNVFVEAARGFLRDVGFELAGDRSFGSGAGIATCSSPHGVLAISQETYNELDAVLAHRDVPGVRRSLRASSGPRDNEAQPSLPLIPEASHLWYLLTMGAIEGAHDDD